ncbi:uroporphyrin-III C-methyltransferase [Sarocladium strictum]
MADIAPPAPLAAQTSPPEALPPQQQSYSTSLLAGLVCTGNTHLIIGSNPLAGARCTQSLAAGAHPILLAPETGETDQLHYALRSKVDDGSVRWEKKNFEDEDLFRLGRDEVGGVVDAVFVTSGPRDPIATHISELCRKNRIPVNVVDSPSLCTFTLLSTYTDGPLQIGVTTNGRGCKLASRVRREIASSLPHNLGDACARLGEIRKRVQEADGAILDGDDLEDSAGQGATFNKLIGVKKEEEREELKTRRMRWLAQVCEYWPLKRLATVADSDVETILNTYPTSGTPSPAPSTPASEVPPPLGRIILAGSGPGHPSLLTMATHSAIQTADLILADKLVPSPVLDLIPRRTPVQIARKFPGNADQAQEELHITALAAVREGKTVLRLKQGDPYVYGRGGEEVKFFWENGIRGDDRVVVLPGVTSALSAPLFAQITATQRDVADQVLICTGTGKKGKPPTPPEYVPSRTVVFLMALHRISGLIQELTLPLETEVESGVQTRKLWPLDTPCAVIERASCPDQRVIRTTLERVAEAIETEGSRPPGLLVVGRACEVLREREEGKAWIVEEGFRGLDGVLGRVGLEGGAPLNAA